MSYTTVRKCGVELSTIQTFRGYPVKVRRFEIAGREYELLGPDEYEKLLDDPGVLARFEKDEFMPYWAEFWPACLLLADAVATWPLVPGGLSEPPRVLEIGCGLGLAGLVAASRGYQVIASDYDDDALAFVTESARRNGLPLPQTRFVDWREFYPDILVERVIAAEVLYEARNLQPIVEFLRNHLMPGGQAWIIDGNRSTADPFEGLARGRGLEVAVTPLRRGGIDGGKPIEGRLFRLTNSSAG